MSPWRTPFIIQPPNRSASKSEPLVSASSSPRPSTSISTKQHSIKSSEPAIHGEDAARRRPPPGRPLAPPPPPPRQLARRGHPQVLLRLRRRQQTGRAPGRREDHSNGAQEGRSGQGDSDAHHHPDPRATGGGQGPLRPPAGRQERLQPDRQHPRPGQPARGVPKRA